jgi:hypothetical protein
MLDTFHRRLFNCGGALSQISNSFMRTLPQLGLRGLTLLGLIGLLLRCTTRVAACEDSSTGLLHLLLQLLLPLVSLLDSVLMHLSVNIRQLIRLARKWRLIEIGMI